MNNVSRDSFSILNNQGLFIEEEETRVHAEMIPWLVNLTVENLKKSASYERTMNNIVASVDNNNCLINSSTVKKEMDRRQFLAEEVYIIIAKIFYRQKG